MFAGVELHFEPRGSSGPICESKGKHEVQVAASNHADRRQVVLRSRLDALHFLGIEGGLLRSCDGAKAKLARRSNAVLGREDRGKRRERQTAPLETQESWLARHSPVGVGHPERSQGDRWDSC